MPAKLTVIVYILICFEVGILLIILPWTPYWDDNFFLYFLTGQLGAEWLGEWMQSNYVRGAVSGIGVLNLYAGIWEIYKFRDSVRAFANWEKTPDEKPADPPAETPPAAAAPPLPDHQPSGAASSSGESGSASGAS